MTQGARQQQERHLRCCPHRHHQNDSNVECLQILRNKGSYHRHSPEPSESSSCLLGEGFYLIGFGLVLARKREVINNPLSVISDRALISGRAFLKRVQTWFLNQAITFLLNMSNVYIQARLSCTRKVAACDARLKRSNSVLTSFFQCGNFS